jgi:hypothetical protein
MGCDQSINHNENKLEDLIFDEEKYTNEIFPYCKIKEETTNLLKYKPLNNFLCDLNNFLIEENKEKVKDEDKDEEEEENQIEKKEEKEDKYSNRENKDNKSEINFFHKKTFLKKSLTLTEFENFFEKNLIKNPLIKNYIFSDEIRLYIFQKFLKEIFLKFQKFLFQNNENNYHIVPKYIISSIGFNFCECTISQKINNLISLFKNKNNLITQKNPKIKNFLNCYFINAIEVHTFNLLNLIERNQFVKEKNFIEILKHKNFIFLKENFLLKYNSSDYDCLYFTNKEGIFNIKEELNITNLIEVFLKKTLMNLFGTNGKKKFTIDEFKNFLIDESEFGGFWILFNESIRRKFELFLQDQTK